MAKIEEAFKALLCRLSAHLGKLVIEEKGCGVRQPGTELTMNDNEVMSAEERYREWFVREQLGDACISVGDYSRKGSIALLKAAIDDLRTRPDSAFVRPPPAQWSF